MILQRGRIFGLIMFKIRVGGGKHNKASVIEQIPMGGYILSKFAKRLELIQ